MHYNLCFSTPLRYMACLLYYFIAAIYVVTMILMGLSGADDDQQWLDEHLTWFWSDKT